MKKGKEESIVKTIAQEKKQQRLDKITEKVAVVFVFVAVFYFFIKLMFL